MKFIMECFVESFLYFRYIRYLEIRVVLNSLTNSFMPLLNDPKKRYLLKIRSGFVFISVTQLRSFSQLGTQRKVLGEIIQDTKLSNDKIWVIRVELL